MLAIIPARGGSKGVPRKNIKMLGDKPLIFWTIEAALKSCSIDRVILSTDDKEIAEICRPTGIEIPFMRPSELAQDDSLAIDNYLYTMDRLINEFNYEGDDFVVLLPTVPFRNEFDIDNAVDIFYKNNSDSVISCRELLHPPSWNFEISSTGIINQNNNSIEKLMNRQDLQTLYAPNGGIYIFKYSVLKEKYNYYTDNTYAYIMPANLSVDIDTETDFKFAEFLAKGLK
ncbi:acylneuraminate cytidylyltransferase family protein [Alphaproteobacteria bacterium]|nr:acylneuraminate cytidylyltransferase family protein [Alphaproteobacteria bacterium]MDC1085881.1 acylneuraminate cytidylyltransferase family protein [Alphaproteobacteria bacterium]